MLILNRRVGDSITIGKDIKITIVFVGSRQVKLGIDAPRGIEVLRDDAKEREPHGRDNGQGRPGGEVR